LNSNLFALLVVEQRNAGRRRKCAALELYRRAHIHQRHILQEQAPVIAGIFNHACA
jgi:hypothetical protein